jgi:hypothetical protein
LGTIDFNTDPKKANSLTSVGPRQNPSNDAFVLKLNANGAYVWAGSMGGRGGDGAGPQLPGNVSKRHGDEQAAHSVPGESPWIFGELRGFRVRLLVAMSSLAGLYNDFSAVALFLALSCQASAPPSASSRRGESPRQSLV